MNPAEGWNNRRRWQPIDLDALPLRERVLADLATHAGARSREIADRLGVSAADAGSALGSLRLQGRADRHGEAPGYQWSLPGALVALTALPRRPASIAPANARRAEKRLDELALLSRLLVSRAPRRTSLADICVALRWGRRHARYRIEGLVALGKAHRVSVEGTPGQWRPGLAP